MANSTQLPTRSFLFKMTLLPGEQGPPVICQVGRVCVAVPKDTENVSGRLSPIPLARLSTELGPLGAEEVLTFSLEPMSKGQTAKLARVYSTCDGVLMEPLYREIHAPTALPLTVAELFPLRHPGSVCKLYLAAANDVYHLPDSPERILRFLKKRKPIIVRLR